MMVNIARNLRPFFCAKILIVLSLLFVLTGCPVDTIFGLEVKLEGTPRVGETLKAKVTGVPAGYQEITSEWLRDDLVVSDVTLVAFGIIPADLKDTSYSLTEDDRGRRIKLRVKLSGYTGDVTSNSVGPVE
jgi:hypothetical protein